MARRKKKMKQQNGRAVQKGWYEGQVKNVPSGFVKFTNPVKKKLSSLV